MNRIEKIKLKRTLKAGDQVWEEGTILRRPFPHVLLPDIWEGNPVLEVLEYKGEKGVSPATLKPGVTHFSPTFKTPDMKEKIVPGIQSISEEALVQRPIFKEPDSSSKPKLLRRR